MFRWIRVSLSDIGVNTSYHDCMYAYSPAIAAVPALCNALETSLSTVVAICSPITVGRPPFCPPSTVAGSTLSTTGVAPPHPAVENPLSPSCTLVYSTASSSPRPVETKVPSVDFSPVGRPGYGDALLVDPVPLITPILLALLTVYNRELEFPPTSFFQTRVSDDQLINIASITDQKSKARRLPGLEKVGHLLLDTGCTVLSFLESGDRR